MCGKKKTKLII